MARWQAQAHPWDGQHGVHVARVALLGLHHLGGRIVVRDVQPEACRRAVRFQMQGSCHIQANPCNPLWPVRRNCHPQPGRHARLCLGPWTWLHCTLACPLKAASSGRRVCGWLGGCSTLQGSSVMPAGSAPRPGACAQPVPSPAGSLDSPNKAVALVPAASWGLPATCDAGKALQRHPPCETAVGAPSRMEKGYPRTKSAPSAKGSYRVLKKKGVEGVSRFWMCCFRALISAGRALTVSQRGPWPGHESSRWVHPQQVRL